MRLTGAVAAWLQTQFEGLFNSFEETQTIGTTASEVVPNSPERVALTMVNLSSDFINVSPIDDATATRGIRLSPNGGAVSLSMDEDYLLPSLRWSAIGDSASLSLFVVEVRRVAAVPLEES